MNPLRVALPDILASNISETTRALLMEPWSYFDKISNALDDWQSVLDQEKEDLRRLDAKLLVSEERLYQGLESIAPAICPTEVFSDTFIPASVLQAGQRSPASSSQEDEDEQQYYHIIGTINILKEKIFNLESDYRIEIRKQDSPAELRTHFQRSNTNIYASYAKRREDLVQEYFDAKGTMNDYAQRCRAKGINVEPPNLPPFLDQTFMDDPDFFIEPKVRDHKALHQAQARILRWLPAVLKHTIIPVITLADAPEDPQVAHASAHVVRYRNPANDRLSTSDLAMGPNRAISFEGELGKDRRRYSAPDLPSLWNLNACSVVSVASDLTSKRCKSCSGDEHAHSEP
jgi:hypothetical protein